MGVLTDVGLTLKIKTALLADERIHATGIDVDTLGGVVSLRGSVPSAVQRELAEEVAIRNGAENLRNELRVTEPESPEWVRPESIPPSFPGVDTPPGAPPSERAGL